MSITEIVQSSGWKKFMAKVYGIGAAVVLVGAMFKLMHWPGASFMIVVGLSVEALIFFFSAFEPLHEDLDWTLVYPELAGISDEDEILDEESGRIQPKGMGLQKFDDLFKEADIQPETIQSLSAGLNNLSQVSSKLVNISEASLATDEYLNNMKQASTAISNFSSHYDANAGELGESISGLANSYKKTAEIVNNSGRQIAEKFSQQSTELSNSYDELTKTVKTDFSEISQEQKQFKQQLAELNKNLNELNSSYENQISGAKKHMEGNEGVYKEMETMMNDLKASVEETQRYKSEMAKLSNSLSELNNIYGNMLSAMSAGKK